MREPGRFFTHGQVSVLSEDPGSGQAELAVVLPACLMQAVTPQLLAAGPIDGYEIRKPLAAWSPTVSDSGFRSADTSVCSATNAEIARTVRESLLAFARAEKVLAFPGDALPMLPMGTYVRFRIRCSAERLLAVLPAMSGAAGVAELRFAFASVLGPLLVRWGRAGEAPPALPEGSYPGSRRRRGPGRGTPSSA